jgi:hypothetical protein
VWALSNGNYVVLSPNWTNGALSNAGAATLGSGTSGISGPVTSGNSLVGTSANAGLQYPVVIDTVNGNFFASFPGDTGGGGGGHVRVAALVLPTVNVPGAQTAVEHAATAIRGISVADSAQTSLTVTLTVGNGTLSVTAIPAGLIVSNNNTGTVTLTGDIGDLNTALASLVYRSNLTFSGTDTLSITASDVSLSTSSSVTLNVQSWSLAMSNLQSSVDSAGLDHGLENSLDHQLQAALASFAAGDTAAGVSQLGAFINHVRAQRGKGIADTSIADTWIMDAQQIIDAVA